MCYLFSNILHGLKRRKVQEGRREVREERLFAAVILVELDDDDGGEVFELEEVRESDPLQVRVDDALSTQVTRSDYLETEIDDELTTLMAEEISYVLK